MPVLRQSIIKCEEFKQLINFDLFGSGAKALCYVIDVLIMTCAIAKFYDCDYHNDESTEYLHLTIRKATLRVTNCDYRLRVTLRIAIAI